MEKIFTLFLVLVCMGLFGCEEDKMDVFDYQIPFIPNEKQDCPKK